MNLINIFTGVRRVTLALKEPRLSLRSVLATVSLPLRLDTKKAAVPSGAWAPLKP